ncbi:MAG: hypothetical protein AAB769_02285 [Patescibacteria group bacterium]
MNTTFLVKTEKALKDEAARLAKEMGIPLTTVVNAYLAQFVRDKKLNISIEPSIAQKKLRELLAISGDMDKGRNIGIRTNDPNRLFKHLSV